MYKKTFCVGSRPVCDNLDGVLGRRASHTDRLRPSNSFHDPFRGKLKAFKSKIGVNVIPSKVGGSLGLWLGLGGLQASELIVKYAIFISKNLRTRMRVAKI